MKWTKYCNSFSLLDPWGKCGLFGLFPWGVLDGTRPMWLALEVLSV